MSVLLRHSFKTANFTRFLKVAIATSNFMNKVYNGPIKFSVSMLKETIALVRDYVSETSGKIYVKMKYEIFLK